MSQAEELLNSLSENDVALNTANPESEGHIVVDSDRFITVPDKLKRIAVANDHNIETVTFDCPRYWDGHDMSTMKVYINYSSADGSLGCYLADNVSVDENDSNIIHFDWVITRSVAAAKGEIAFLVCIKKTDANGNEERHWNSELCRDMYVSEGLECMDYLEKAYPDLYTQLLQQIDTFNDTYPDLYPKVVEAKNEAIEAKNEAIKVKDEAIKVKDEASNVTVEAKKILDLLKKYGIVNGVMYTPNVYRHFYQDEKDDIFSSSSSVVTFYNSEDNKIRKTQFIKSSLLDAECSIWQMANYCRILYRVPLDYKLFQDIWESAGSKPEVAKEALSTFIIHRMYFNLSQLKIETGVKVKPAFKSQYNAGLVHTSYDFIDFSGNLGAKFLGKVEVPSIMRWKQPITDNILEIQLQSIGNFMYNPNYLYPNSSGTDINFPTNFTVDITFPCEEIGGKVGVEDIVKNYIEISATEVSTQNNTMYSGGVEK